jgi:hypothetical protein
MLEKSKEQLSMDNTETQAEVGTRQRTKPYKTKTKKTEKAATIPIVNLVFGKGERKTWRVSYEKQGLFTLRTHMGSPSVFR